MGLKQILKDLVEIFYYRIWLWPPLPVGCKLAEENAQNSGPCPPLGKNRNIYCRQFNQGNCPDVRKVVWYIFRGTKYIGILEATYSNSKDTSIFEWNLKESIRLAFIERVDRTTFVIGEIGKKEYHTPSVKVWFYSKA